MSPIVTFLAEPGCFDDDFVAEAEALVCGPDATARDGVARNSEFARIRRLRTPRDSSACGARVAVGECYWFFTGANGEFTKCSHTQPAHDEQFALDDEVIDEIVEAHDRRYR